MERGDVIRLSPWCEGLHPALPTVAEPCSVLSPGCAQAATRDHTRGADRTSAS